MWGLIALRLATSDVLPFDPPLQAAALETYLAALSPSSSYSGSDGGNNPDETTASLPSLSEADLAPLRNAVAAFRTAAESVGSWSSFFPVNTRSKDGTVTNAASGGSVPVVAAAAAARAVALRGAAPRWRQVGVFSDDLGGSTIGGEKQDEGGYTRAAVASITEDLNERLTMTERRFLVEEGLPGRQWFRHVLQAPGLYLG